MSLSLLARERLNALYNHVDGDLACRRAGAEANEKLNGVHVAAIEAGEVLALSPETANGEIAFYALTDNREALAEIDARLPATFVTRSADGSITLVYAMTGARVGDPRFPEPEWVFTDEEIIAGDLANPVVYDADLVARSIWVDPLNDATSYGVITEEQGALPLKISFGRNSHDKRWPAQDLTFANLLSVLTRHEEGQKDGKSFTQGEAIDGARTRTAMRNMCLLGGDIDTGQPLEEVHAILMRAGLTAILYTTHSHMTTRTAVSYDALVRWMKKVGRGEDEPTIGDVSAYLMEVRHLDPRVAATISALVVEQNASGKQAIVEHAPMSKCRVVFPLARPFDFAKEGKLHADAIRKWAAKIRGLFTRLGIPIDESCTDPSRLFYLPRHQKGRPFDIRVYSGRLLDLDEVETVERGASTASNAFLAAGAKDAGKDEGEKKDPRRFTAPDGTDVLGFVKARGDGFDIMSFFEVHAPDRIRSRDGDKMTVECPYDRDHSNPGDPDDPGCFIASPSPEREGGFVFRCRHNSCAGHGSTDMLCEAIRQGWFSGASLYDEAFDLLPRDASDDRSEAPADATDSEAADEPAVTADDAPEALATVTRMIERMTEATDDASVIRAMRALAKTGARPIQIDRVVDLLCDKTRRRKNVVMKEYKEFLKEVPKPEKKKKKTEKVIFRFDDGFDANATRLFNLLMKEQLGADPFLFNKDDYLVLKKDRADGTASFQTATFLKFRSYVAGRTIWYGDSDSDIEPHRPVVEEVLTQMDQHAPLLDNIVTSPFFDADGSYYCAQGYHPQVATFINADTSEIPAIPEEPTYEEMIAARDFLLEPFCDFPFHDTDDPSAQASRAHLLMMILQPLIRRVIGDQPTPLYAINKPQPGSGSSLIVQLVAMIHSGVDPASRSLPRNEDEIRKTISGILAQRDQVAWFDNVSQFVNSDILNATLTSTTHADRPMGELASTTFRNYAQWIVTGNNLRFSKDTARRMLLIRLELDEAIDVDRNFRFPNVKEYVHLNRPALVAAALTLIRYWFQTRPLNWESQKGPMLATFETYSRIANSLLAAVDMPGFLANAAAGAEAADDATAAWTAFMQAIYDTVGLGVPLEVGRVGGSFNASAKTLIQIFEENHIEVEVNTQDHMIARGITRELRKHADSITTIRNRDGERLNVKIRAARSSSTGGQRWVLVDAKDTTKVFD